MRRLHAEKRGLRCLGIAESFAPRARTSTLAGVVMRRDGAVDGAVMGASTVSGSDATDSIASMHARLGRSDVSLTMVSGLVISMYNTVDVARLARLTGAPAIAVTWRESAGLEGAIRRHFAEPAAKLAECAALPRREAVRLRTGHTVLIARAGCPLDGARAALDAFTTHGAVPEPIRVARALARAVARR
ncbi:MAG: DUF99 family protein [Thaumarchaeota archaeon]|nr:DUF99 family protein [Nitrososphaerota archaeon]